MNMTKQPPLFISFEGIDFSGKSTQCRRVLDWLRARGQSVVFVREPGGTPISERIRALLLDRTYGEMCPESELFLFSAARAQLVRETITPALAAGSNVVADRFHDSTTAYQGYGRGIDLQILHGIHNLAINETKPDLTFYFDIDYEESRRRFALLGRADDRMEASDRAFFNRVRDGYRSLAAAEPRRFAIMDGRSAPDDITDHITSILEQHFPERHNS